MQKKLWKNLDNQEKATRVIGYVVLALALLFTAFVIFGRLLASVSALPFYQDVDIFQPYASANAWTRSLSYVVCILTLSYVVRMLIGLSLRWFKRGGAIISLLTSFIKYTAIVVIIFFILSAFGVDTNALIAGIGILSLIVGLAIQPLLQDIIAGVFVVFEKTYDVGDVVVVDGFRGTVIEIGIRATKLQDAGGDVKVINNSDIRTLINMTSELSCAICDVDIEYSESLERVEQVLEDNLATIKEKVPSIADGPYYKGVVALGSSGVTIRLIAQCLEQEKFQTQRDINRQIKLIFDSNDVGIPYPQIVVHKAEKNKAPVASGAMEQFVLQQNEMSKDLNDEET